MSKRFYQEPAAPKENRVYLESFCMSEKDRRKHEDDYTTVFFDEYDDRYHSYGSCQILYGNSNNPYSKLVPELKKAIYSLTDKQQSIVNMFFSGMKQIDIAKEMGVTQGNISLAFTGSKQGTGATHGGIIKKLGSIISHNMAEKQCAADMSSYKSIVTCFFKAADLVDTPDNIKSIFALALCNTKANYITVFTRSASTTIYNSLKPSNRYVKKILKIIGCTNE